MSRRSLHSSTSASDDGNDQVPFEMSEEEYIHFARKKFTKLFMELSQRSERAAEINYTLAAQKYEEAYKFYIVGTILGTSSMTWLDSDRILNWNATAFVLLIVLLAFFGGVSKILFEFYCFLSGKAKKHIEAAAGWQIIELKLRAYMIQLKDPRLTVDKYNEWWIDILTERRQLCLTSIPYKVHEEFAEKYPVTKRDYELKAKQEPPGQNK